MKSVVVEGQTIPGILLQVEKQPEVGTSAYDKGAQQLTDFFHKELTQFLEADLHPLGRRIIECCLAGGSVDCRQAGALLIRSPYRGAAFDVRQVATSMRPLMERLRYEVSA
jgi:hypothetical protein